MPTGRRSNNACRKNGSSKPSKARNAKSVMIAGPGAPKATPTASTTIGTDAMVRQAKPVRMPVTDHSTERLPNNNSKPTVSRGKDRAVAAREGRVVPGGARADATRKLTQPGGRRTSGTTGMLPASNSTLRRGAMMRNRRIGLQGGTGMATGKEPGTTTGRNKGLHPRRNRANRQASNPADRASPAIGTAIAKIGSPTSRTSHAILVATTGTGLVKPPASARMYGNSGGTREVFEE